MHRSTSFSIVVLRLPTIRLLYVEVSGFVGIRDSQNQELFPVWYMLLGYSSHKAPISLVLVEKVDMSDSGTYERIGYFESPDLVEPHVRLNKGLQSVEKRRFTII